MRSCRVFAATVAVLSATFAVSMALAQENSTQDGTNKARLEEFALPTADRSIGVQQLSSESREVPPQPVGDRDVSGPRAAAPTGPLVQVTPAGEAIRPVQRDPAQARSARGVSDLSARVDSAPGAVAVLSGNDACDPQNRPALLDAVMAESCRRILELRAAEFDAPAPPVLSAEQRIIVEQQRRNTGQEGLKTDDMTARALARASDPDSRSSQELASLVLPPPNGGQPAPPVTPDSPATDAGLSELLQSLVVQLGAPPSP